jgi:hypothetical protein
MGVTGGPNIIRDSSLVLELDAADRNSYPGSGNTWNDLTLNSIATISGSAFSQNTLYFSGSTNRVLVSNQTVSNNCSIEIILNPYNTTINDKYLVYSDNFKIISYSSSSTYYFIRRVTNTTASFGDSTINGHTGIKVDVNYETFNHILFSHNSTTGEFKVYKNGSLYRTVDGFYNNSLLSSSGYGSLVSGSTKFLIGSNLPI